jgi:hypothetical protein
MRFDLLLLLLLGTSTKGFFSCSSAMLIRTWWTVREVTADRPRGHRGPSAMWLTAQLFFVFLRVLERLSFDPYCRWVFGA